jgi:hypothetical protein
VDIAEIGTALPVAVGLSFVEASKDVISVKTRVTLKNRQRWFYVPGGTLPDLKAIFRSSYEQVYPGRWSRVGGLPETVSTTGPSIDDIAAALERVSIGYLDVSVAKSAPSATSPPAAAAAPAKGKYIPPHLRKRMQEQQS